MKVRMKVRMKSQNESKNEGQNEKIKVANVAVKVSYNSSSLPL